MTEQFANFAQSTLAAPISAYQKTITVANAATFPLQPQFRIVVQSFDPTTGLPISGKEIMLVTGVAGNTFTVQRAAESSSQFPAIAFASGATVAHINTAAVMQALQAGSGGSITLNAYSAAGNNTASSATATSVQQFIMGVPGYIASGYNFAQFTAASNSYAQISVQNSSAGANGSSDLVVTANDGSDTTHYADFGINGSNGGTAAFINPHAAYLYTVDNELDIAALGASGNINFYTTGGASTPVKAGFFDATQNLNLSSGLVVSATIQNAALTVSQLVGTDASKNLSSIAIGSGLSLVSGTLSATGSGTGTVTSVAMTGDGVIFSSTVSGSPITSAGTLAPALLAQTSAKFLASPVSATGTPTFRAISATDVPTLNQNTTGQAATVNSISANIVASSNITITGSGTLASPYAIAGKAGTVSSVAMTGDGTIFSSTVSGSPITSAGTLAPALLAQTANKFLCGPVSGAAAAPTFRVISATDLPSGTGTVTSVAMTGDGVIFSSTVSGSPITSAGTLAPALLAQAKNLALLSPVSATGTPTFRAISAADLPTIPLSAGGTGQNFSASTGFVTAAGGTATCSAITFGYNFNQAVSANGTLVLSPYVPFACTITNIYQIQANSAGTCTASFQIGSAAITGISAIAVTSAAQNVSATAANVVSAGNVLNLVITSATSLTQLIFTLAATRTS